MDVNKIHFILDSASIGNLCDSLFEQLDFYRGEKENGNIHQIRNYLMDMPWRIDLITKKLFF